MRVGRLGPLFENRVIEATETVSLTLGILKNLEFATCFVSPGKTLPNQMAYEAYSNRQVELQGEMRQLEE